MFLGLLRRVGLVGRKTPGIRRKKIRNKPSELWQLQKKLFFCAALVPYIMQLLPSMGLFRHYMKLFLRQIHFVFKIYGYKAGAKYDIKARIASLEVSIPKLEGTLFYYHGRLDSYFFPDQERDFVREIIKSLGRVKRNRESLMQELVTLYQHGETPPSFILNALGYGGKSRRDLITRKTPRYI